MPTDPPLPHPPTTRYGPGFATHGTRHRKPKNGLVIAGFLIGLAALGVAFVPVAGLAAWPLAVIGMTLSVIGLIKIKKGEADKKGMGVAGLALSIAGLLAASGLLVYTNFFATGATGLHIPAVAGDKNRVEFVVSASGGATVRYGSLNDQRSETTPASTDEWRGTASFNSGDYLLTVTADTRNSSVSNQIACSILVNGRKVAENKGQTIALCTAHAG
jgi:hypothetical protein